MKAIFRTFGVIVMGIYYILMLMTFGQINIIEQEINDISSQAMTQTQTVMREQIEDRIYNTQNARETFKDSADYYGYFIDQINKFKSTKAEYSVDVYTADVNKGLLSVRVNARYKRVDGSYKTVSVKKIGIVDIIDSQG